MLCVETCKSLFDLLLKQKISVDEAEKILHANNEIFLIRAKYLRKHKCFFCGQTARGTRRIVICENCGISVGNIIEKYLLKYDADVDEIKRELAPFRKQLVGIFTKARSDRVARIIVRLKKGRTIRRKTIRQLSPYLLDLMSFYKKQNT